MVSSAWNVLLSNIPLPYSGLCPNVTFSPRPPIVLVLKRVHPCKHTGMCILPPFPALFLSTTLTDVHMLVCSFTPRLSQLERALPEDRHFCLYPPLCPLSRVVPAPGSYSVKINCRAHSPRVRDWTLPPLMFMMTRAKALGEAELLPTTSGGLWRDHRGPDAQRVCLLLRQMFLGVDGGSLFLILSISHKIPNPSQSWGPQKHLPILLVFSHPQT